MPSTEEVKAYFDTVAPNWDNMRQDYYGTEVIYKAVEAARLSRRLSAISGQAQADVLGAMPPRAHLLVDVGCGTGFLSAGLCPLTEKVVGIDSSPGMLGVAQENLLALGLHNVELRQGSVEALPLESGSADATFANMVLHHAPDPQRMVTEMTRITKQGGRVVITDMDSHTNEWFRAEMADVWLGFTQTEVENYLQRAGLADVEFGWVGTQ